MALDSEALTVAAITGVVSGFILSFPIGPINLTIMNEGARRGFLWAGMIGLGATVMEVLYCTIAFTSFASIFTHKFIKASMELFSFAFMLFLGIRFLVAKTVPATNKFEERIEEKLHPHSAFWIGFVRVMGNPGVLAFWVILAANFISRGWVQTTLSSKLACIGGVAFGTGIWFLGLSWAVSLGHKKFSEKTLLRMEHFSGIGLIGLALAHGFHMAYQIAKNKI